MSKKLQITLSNEFGTAPLTFNSVFIGHEDEPGQPNDDTADLTYDASIGPGRTSSSPSAVRSQPRSRLYEAQDAIDARPDELIENIERQLEQRHKLETLFTARWSVE